MIEYELGAPIPGPILPPDQWVQTALKKYPAGGPIVWAELYGRVAPVVLDIGCGNGRFTLSSAVNRPDFDHLAVDTLPVVIRYARRRGNQRGLTNVRFAVGSGQELLANHVAPASVREIHCYHPQPYYDARLVHRRLITPEFLSLAHRALEQHGLFVFQTDNPGYWRYARAVLLVFFDFHERNEPWPDAPEGRTRREIIAMRQGLPIFRGTGTPRRDLSVTEARAKAEALPPPTFDADRRLRQLDELEKSG